MRSVNTANQEIIASTVSIKTVTTKGISMTTNLLRKVGPASTLFVQKVAEVAWHLFELKHLIEYGTEPDFSQPHIYVGSRGHSFELDLCTEVDPRGDGCVLHVGSTEFVFNPCGILVSWKIPTLFRSEEQWIDWLHQVEAGL